MGACLLSLLTVLAGGVTGVGTAMAQAGDAPELEAPAQEAIAVKGMKGQDEEKAYVTVVNQGSIAASISASFQASSATSVKASLVPTPTTIAPGEAARVKLVFTGLKKLEEPASGQIVIKGGARAIVQAATITPALQPAADWPFVIVIAAMGLGVLMFLMIVGDVTLRADGSKTGGKDDSGGAWREAGEGAHENKPEGRRKRLSWLASPAPPPKWGLESWASHLTAAGGILGTVLGSASLPETPTQIDKSSVTALSLAFAALVVVAPFVFEAVQRPVVKSVSEGEEEGGWGFTGVLVLTCAITFGAVVGELFTLGLVSWELTGGEGWVWPIEASLLVLALLGAYYVYVTTRRVAVTDFKAEGQEKAKASMTAYAAAPEFGEGGPPPEVLTVPTRVSWPLP
jgi:hypothetical protein